MSPKGLYHVWHGSIPTLHGNREKSDRCFDKNIRERCDRIYSTIFKQNYQTFLLKMLIMG
ncbi:hypothetical protein [Planktothrix agardhii]|uniref:Uncharacterized protein n=1 Tax=Planktothrix agardhii TaxID=1160 RepID=A0A1J1JF54_PLAAG|nr:hypothetical protein [Planktothrix agardhii]MBG0745890.1 hypothetical protein [Planktothrix agardhii KL2]MCB8749268.1 hypothetical protein [Planktothrix agardhii 1810]MCB8757971.1 hypothetical protein [Planktothrix agardhii 1813]MCB8758030.1 hypothetical protein [Planktothrix agardhii 1813]MCF3572718.1 hypothetical protein [Planktothrix agardhii 1805]